jgi:hypothetical protein
MCKGCRKGLVSLGLGMIRGYNVDNLLGTIVDGDIGYNDMV